MAFSSGTEAKTSSSALSFETFLTAFQNQSESVVQAKLNLSQAQAALDIGRDQYSAELVAKPKVEHQDRRIDGTSSSNTYTRATDVVGQYRQRLPTGTNINVSGQKFIEKSNLLLSAVDSDYSVSVTQDLYRNTMGLSQRRQAEKASLDYNIAEMEFRQANLLACEEAFSVYADAYIQQEMVAVLNKQLADAKKALDTSRRPHNSRLIHKVDLLSSESDYLNTKMNAARSKQLYENAKRQLAIYLQAPVKKSLKAPKGFLGKAPKASGKDTLKQIIADKRVESQELEVSKVKSDNRPDVKLGIELGQREGRFSTGPSAAPFRDDYVNASLTFSLPLFNKTQNANLNLALETRNNLAVQKELVNRSQPTLISNLSFLQKLLSEQVKTSKKRIKLLNEKANIAFRQMKSGKMEFENYLLHRNAYRNEQVNYLQLQKDLWLNHFALKREFSSMDSPFCQGAS